MRLLTILAVLVSSASFPGYANAANEWKNPDLERAPARAEAVPVRPAPAPAPVKKLTSPATLTLQETLRLNTIRVCEYRRTWRDKGSGGKIDGAFYMPIVPAGYAMIGGYAQGNYHSPSDCVIAVKPADDSSIALLQIPGNWNSVWTDRGSGASKDGAIWQASPQSQDYVCLGSIAQGGYTRPATGNYVCVHQCLVEKTPAGTRVWSSKGTGANQTAYVYKLNNSNSFVTLNHNQRPGTLQDLRGDASCRFQ